MTIDEIVGKQKVPQSETLNPIKLHGDIKPDSDSQAFRLYPKHNRQTYYYVIRKSDAVAVEQWSADQLKHFGIFGSSRFTVSILRDATIARVTVEVFSAAKPPQGRFITRAGRPSGKSGCSCRSTSKGQRDPQVCCDENDNCWNCPDDPNICCQDSPGGY